MGQHRPDHVERPGEVDLQVTIPGGGVDAVGAGHVAEDAGRVHEDVDAPVLGDNLVDRALHRIGVTDVELHVGRARVVGPDHGRSVGGEHPHDLGADRAGTPGWGATAL